MREDILIRFRHADIHRSIVCAVAPGVSVGRIVDASGAVAWHAIEVGVEKPLAIALTEIECWHLAGMSIRNANAISYDRLFESLEIRLAVQEWSADSLEEE